MTMKSRLLTSVCLLSALAGCQAPRTPSKAPTSTTKPTAEKKTEAVNATPTGERGIYRISLGMEQITQVQVVSTQGDAADGRIVDPTRWSFDMATGRLHVDAPVDDLHESVVVIGERHRPPNWRLHEDVDPDTVRVVVGDHLGVEGQDYAIDRGAGVLQLIGTDTPEAPLCYYVQYSLRSDPMHPEQCIGVAFGNHHDQETVRRLLGIEPR